MRLLAALALVLPACVIDPGEPGSGPEPPPYDTIVTAGFSFGECLGWCSGDLALGTEPAALTLHSTDGANQVNTGTLSRTTRIELRDIGADLAATTLAPTYGCPDCADGGASWIGRSHLGQFERSTYQYSEPPAVLTRADAVIAEIIDGLRTCQSNPRITIVSCTAH